MISKSKHNPSATCGSFLCATSIWISWTAKRCIPSRKGTDLVTDLRQMTCGSFKTWPPNSSTILSWRDEVYVTFPWIYRRQRKKCCASFQTQALRNQQLPLPVPWDTPSWNPAILLWDGQAGQWKVLPGEGMTTNKTSQMCESIYFWSWPPNSIPATPADTRYSRNKLNLLSSVLFADLCIK